MVNKIDIVILIESMNHLGGTEIVALNLRDGLNAAGTSTVILSIEDYMGNDVGIICMTEADRVKYSIKKTHFNKLFVKRYTNSVKQFILDFCTVNRVKMLLNFTYEKLAVLPLNAGFRTVGVYHWSVIGYERALYNLVKRKPFMFRLFYDYVIRQQYQQLRCLIGETDYAVALTEAGKYELEKISPKANVKVIPNFLPFNERARTIASGNNRKAVFVGRLSREKGIYHLLDIWQKVSQSLTDVELDIFGDGGERIDMMREIKARNIQRINFRGFESELEKIYKNADMLLCTSETEGFGMVLIEAMYFGVVPIAFDCPVSPKELIADAGITIDCFNTKQYADAVIRLFNSPEAMAELRSKGLKRAELFYENHIISKWLQLID